MPTRPHRESIIRDLDSKVPPPNDYRRRRIAGRLLSIGDTVYINQLDYNGTIIDFRGSKVMVLPHDYGYPDLFHVRLLRPSQGINAHQRVRLEELGYYYYDHLLLNTGTHPASHRRFQTVHNPYEWRN